MSSILPILDETPKTISYSALTNFQLCPHYYYLTDIKRLKPWKNSPDTIFGTCIHKAVQDVLSDVMSVDEAIKTFNKKWNKLCKLYKKYIVQDDIDLSLSAPAIIEKIKPALVLEFGTFSVVSIEERLALPSGEKWPQIFKGFVDCVLRLDNGKIVVIDFKTANSSFFFKKYQDKIKDYQLSLYKHFYCEKHKFDPNLVETYFIVLEKNHKSKKPISCVRVTSGNIKIQNALKWLDFSLSAINRKIFIKNRGSCLKFGDAHPCAFYKSSFCP